MWKLKHQLKDLVFFFLGECFEVFFTHQVIVLVVVNFETVNFVSHFEIDLDCGQLITKLESSR